MTALRGARGRTALRLLALAAPYRGRVALAVLSFAAAGLIVLGLGRAVRLFVDEGVRRGGPHALASTASELLVLVALYGAAGLARVYLAAFLADRIVVDLRERVVRRLLQHSPAFFDQESSHLVWSRFSADAALIQSTTASATTAARSLLIVAGGLAAMLATSVALTAYVAVAAPVITWSVVRLVGRLRRLSDLAQEEASGVNARALELLDHVRLVKAFNGEGAASGRLRRLSESAFAAADRRNLANGVLNGVSAWMIFGGGVGLLWIAGAQVIRGEVSEGAMTAFLFFAVTTASSAATLSDTWGQLQRGVGAADRVFALIDAPVEIVAAEDARPLARPVRGAVEFETVRFSYPTRPDVPALDGFSWRMEPDTVLALVGPSGAGKSTLFQLLLRFHDPQEGAVRLDGLDLRALDPAELRAQIGLVPQESVLLEGTVAENIGFGRPSATRREIEAAAEHAQAMEFVARLPQGMDTPLGVRGAQLSGGQRQRLAIARALVRDPRILLLDEATSALDPQSEHLVQRALGTLMAGRTTVVIAHRLSTVRRADTILVMDRGVVVDHGTHDDLGRRGGLYARYIDLQTRGEAALDT